MKNNFYTPPDPAMLQQDIFLLLQFSNCILKWDLLDTNIA